MAPEEHNTCLSKLAQMPHLLAYKGLELGGGGRIRHLYKVMHTGMLKALPLVVSEDEIQHTFMISSSRADLISRSSKLQMYPDVCIGSCKIKKGTHYKTFYSTKATI